MELTSRVKAVLRRTSPTIDTADKTYSAENLTLSVSKHEVTVSGEPVVLTLKEFALLELLFVHRGSLLEWSCNRCCMSGFIIVFYIKE